MVMRFEVFSAFWSILRPVCLVAGVGVCLLLVCYVLGRLVGALGRSARVDVAGRWVLVTGCDSGFGRGVVEQLVARGAHVVACCLTSQGAAQALEAGARSAPCFDLTDEAALERVAREVEEACEGRLWGLVHNAGVVLPGFVDYLPLSFYRKVMEVNFFVPVSLTRKLLPCLRRSKGRIVLVSSVDGLVSLPGNAPYDASKFAIEAYADALRVELSFWDVAVSVINPSTMRTPLAMTFFEAHRKAWEAQDAEESDGEWKQAYPRVWLDAYIAENTRQLAKMAQDPGHAIRDIVHALCAKRPRHRYLSGTLARTLFYALWIGPEAWAHRIKRSLIQPPPHVQGDKSS